MRTEDGYIIQQCLDGKSAMFGFLVDKYKRGVYALVYSEIGTSMMHRTSLRKYSSKHFRTCTL